MAKDVESLVLQMSADLRRFDKSMDAMRRTADKRLNDVEKRALQADRRLSRTMGNAGRNMVGSLKNSLSGIAPVIAGAFSVKAVLAYADSYTALQNRLRATGLEGAALKRVEDSLYEAANRNGVAVSATAELYQRAAMARNNLGASESQLLALVSGTSAALKLQGTSATEASGALLQLGQILGGEKVQAQEYNSLIDQLPVLLQAAANGSGKFGGEIATLTQQVKAGKVTTQEFFAALLKGLGDIEARAAAATPTVGAAFQTLNNEIGRFVGQTDQGLSATQRMAQGLVTLSENLDTVVKVIGVLATLVGTRYFLALTANSGALIANGFATAQLIGFQTAMTASMTGTTTASVVATGAMARLNAVMLANPVGAIAVAFGVLVGAIILLGNVTDGALTPTKALTSSTDALKRATDAYTEASEAAATATGAEGKAAREAAAQKRELAAAARDAARAKLAEAQATIALVGIEARRKIQSDQFNFRGDAAGRTNAISSEDRERVRQARADATAAATAIASANSAISAADASLARGGGGGAPAAPSGDGGGRNNAAQIAKAREALALEQDIARARSTGDEAAIKAAEERQQLAQLTAQYVSAGYADANARAIDHLSLLNAAEKLVEDRAKAEEEVDAILAGRERQMERDAEYAQLINDRLMDRLGFERELAGLIGEAGALGDSERRLWIEERTNEILRLRLALTEDEARAKATGEFDKLRSAEIVGGLGGREDPAATAAAMYEEVNRLRQEDLLSEEEATQRKAQINAEYWDKRTAGTRTMLDSLASLQGSSNKKIAALGKAAAIAQATMDGVLAVQKALASAPPPFNFVQAAIVGAVAAANVASIAGMADGGLVSGAGGPREDNQLRWLSSGEFVNNAASTRKNRPYLEAANNGADLSKVIPGLAAGGMVGRANAASAGVTSGQSRGASSSVTFAPTIDARGADLAAVARLERVLAEQSRDFADNVRGVVSHQKKYRLGSGK
jgi:tape measure domain-containing protein